MPVKILLILVGAYLLPAESVHSLLEGPGRFKVSGGLLLHWKLNPSDPHRDAVEGFNRNGTRVFGANIYTILPTAKTISIDDIAVRPNESIAVAAVTSGIDGRFRAWLLQISWDGRLTGKTELNAANEIGWLDYDEVGNIWGLTDYQGEKVRKDTISNGIPCPLGPLILAFNSEGKIVKSILKQADFPDSLEEGPNIGQVSFGLTDDRVWFWQPTKHRMVITNRDGRSIQKISIPHARSWNLGGQSVLAPTGEVIQELHSPNPKVRGIYVVKHRRTEKLHQPQNAFFVGMDGAEFVFLSEINETDDFLVSRMRSLTDLQTLPGGSRQ